MTDEVYEIRCSDCHGIFVNGNICHILGWIRPTPILTIEEEVKYDYDAGNLCKTCYNFRISQLMTKSSHIN
jgi:hypothetical protein